MKGKVAALEQLLAEKVRALESQIAQLRNDVEPTQSSKTVALSSLGSPQYRLRQSLWVELDASGDGVTAHVPELEEYGTGATEYEAVSDFRSVLLDTYVFLLENEPSLGPAPANQLLRFRDLVERQ